MKTNIAGIFNYLFIYRYIMILLTIIKKNGQKQNVFSVRNSLLLIVLAVDQFL